MCPETTLGEFAISLVLVISLEPVNVETESRNFSALEAQRVYRCKTIIPVPIFLHTCMMGDQTVHEDSNNPTHFKYKYTEGKKFSNIL